MELVVLLCRLVLVITFIVSATAKFNDKAGARQAVTDFGIPATYAGAVAGILGPLELLSALLLLTTGWGVVAGAVLAIALLAAFTLGIIVNLARGNRVDCHCFGSLSHKPLSWWSVVRNIALIALAAVVLTGGSTQGFPWQELHDVLAPLSTTEAWLTVAVLVLATVVLTLAALFYQLLRRYGSVLVRVESLEANRGVHDHGHAHGSSFSPWEAPALSLVAASGASVELKDLMVDDRASLFVFVSPTCEGCGDLVDDLVQWQANDNGPQVVVLSPGDRPAITAKFGAVDVLAHDGRVMDDYRMEFTPGALVVSTDGFITVPPSYGRDEILRLYTAMADGAAQDIEIGPPPIREGDPVPDVEVTVDGKPVSIAHAAGEDSVLLFWDTTCGFCQQITDDVVRRQNSTPLLLVLRGNDVDQVRASGLTAPIAVDPGFVVGNALQAPGTPVAVRVQNGTVASTVAVGGPEVLDLLAAVRVLR